VARGASCRVRGRAANMADVRMVGASGRSVRGSSEAYGRTAKHIEET